jgi:hypothetical protein
MSQYKEEQQLTKEQLNAIEKIMFTDFKLPRRFWDRTKKVKDCLLWTGSLNSNGYGQFTIFGKNNRAHRLSYMERNGPIDIDMVIDHTCVNASCVNPDHLEMVTEAENEHRKIERRFEKLSYEERRSYRTIYIHGEKRKVLDTVMTAHSMVQPMYFELYENLCGPQRYDYMEKCDRWSHRLQTKKFARAYNGLRYDTNNWDIESEKSSYSYCVHGNRIPISVSREVSIYGGPSVGVWTKK